MTFSFLFLSAFTIWLLMYTYRVECKLEDTEEALCRSRDRLSSEIEYAKRTERKLLTYQTK